MTQMSMEATKALLARLKAEAQDQGQGSGEKTRWYRLPKEGSEVTIRFLPPSGNAHTIGFLARTHFQIPLQERNNIKCLQTWGMDCPLCNLVNHYKEKYDCKRWEPALSSNFNALIREVKLADSTGVFVTQNVENPHLPRIVQFSGDYNYRWLLEKIIEPKVGDITDPINGADIIFTRNKAGHKFERTIARISSPIANSQAEVEKIMSSMYDFEQLFRKPDDDYFILMQQCVAAVKKTIEEKLMPLSDAGHMQGGQPMQNFNQFQQQSMQPGMQHPYNAAPPAPNPGYNVSAPPAPNPGYNVSAPNVPTQPQQPQHQQIPPNLNPQTPEFKGTPVEQSNPQQPNPQTQQRPLNASDIKPPKGAPKCFADVNTYNGDDQKCFMCHVEWDCKQAVNKLKAKSGQDGTVVNQQPQMQQTQQPQMQQPQTMQQTPQAQQQPQMQQSNPANSVTNSLFPPQQKSIDDDEIPF